mgnify:CR=1 FL=1
MEQIETIGATEQRELTRIRISVRNLVEFIFRSGDIDNRIGKGAQKEAMQEGSRMHRKIQGRMGMEYRAEVPLKLEVPQEQYVLALEGRADGIITNADGVTVDEIKCMYTDVTRFEKPIFVHKAQAMCYAYIYALQNGLDQISVQLTYCDLDTEEICRFEEAFSFFWLERWFQDMMEAYRKWTDFQFAWRKIRQTSIQTLEFPFPYREGQYKLVGDVYRTIHRKKILFIQAPTGTGKTISTLFPAIRAVGENLGDKIFYLTAKTITRTVAKDTCDLLKAKGYRGKVIVLTAKEKMCPCEEMDCNPSNCLRAKGHYDRVNDAVYDLITTEENFTRERMLAQAEKYQVCPFEMSLDASLYADIIICDYNYVFDPNVYLKRFFAEGIRGDYIFLVDEAHNLVERSREMYSAEIYKEDFLAVKKIVKRYRPGLEQQFNHCNRILLEYKRECEKYKVYDNIGNLMFYLMKLASELDEFLQRSTEFPERKEVSEFYFGLRNFINIYERVDEHYVIYTEHMEDERFKMKLYCVDPSLNLQECIDRGNSAIFFSATFLPIQYYKNLLSTKKDNYAVYAETAFSEEQSLLLMGSDVSSRYTRRNQSEFERIAQYIQKTGLAKKGNYMVFFPSYKMMQQVYEVFQELDGGNVEAIIQEPGMNEEKREAFLAEFSAEREKTLIAFCVMGGIFGEGIDLKKEQLIGAVIVGTGLPQISNEREILMDYYEKRMGEGFDYAYRYPGMNKVLQAAGRVIRTIDDVGVIELLDERFLQSDYRNLFPKEWEKRLVCTVDSVDSYLEKFWEEKQ